MLYVYGTLLLLWNSAGLVLVPFGLPGIWVMALGTAGLAWWQWDSGMIGLPVLAVILVLAVAAEVVELVSGVVGSKKAGGTRGGSVGGLLGGLVGAIFFTPIIPIPVLGTIFGACLGALLGAAGFEMLGGQPLQPALRSGGGAAMGRFVGTVAKLAFGSAIWLLAAIAVFWP